MRRLPLTLLAALFACGPAVPPPAALAALELEERLTQELALQREANEALRAKVADQTELQAFVAAEKRLEHAPAYGGAMVWSAIARPVLEGHFRSAADELKARVTFTTSEATPGELGFVLTVQPPRLAPALARRLADEAGSRPTALVSSFDAATGLVSGRFPLDPLPVPPDPARPPAPSPVEAPATERGPALAAALFEAKQEGARLTLEVGRAEANRARVREYDRRLALFARVGDRRASQRVLLAGAVTLGATAGRFTEDDLALELTLPRAARRPALPTLRLVEEGGSARLTHAGSPPSMPDYAARAAEARSAVHVPTPGPKGAPRPIATGLAPGR